MIGNFRDLGGLETLCGRKTIKGRLLRSALPANLNEAGLEQLRAHNVRHIVDFRTSREVKTEPVTIVDGIAYTHIDIMGENNAQAADPNYWLELMNNAPERVEEEFTQTYREFALSESSRKGYAAFIRTCLAQTEGGLLFHCAAGKDRTGYGAAVILRILGVYPGDIIRDYLKTNEFNAEMAKIAIEKAIKSGMNETQLASMKITTSVDLIFLQAALTAAESAYGGFDGYVKTGLGITQGEIDGLRSLYLT